MSTQGTKKTDSDRGMCFDDRLDDGILVTLRPDADDE